MKPIEQISEFNQIKYDFLRIKNVDEIKRVVAEISSKIDELTKRTGELKKEITDIKNKKTYRRVYGNCISRLFSKSLVEEAKPLLERINELESEIKRISSNVQALEKEAEPYNEKIGIIKKYEFLTNEKTIGEFLNAFLSKMKYKKDVEHLSPTMYREMYKWIEHLYNVGYKETEKYEAILLFAEKEVYCTPKKIQEYCEQRLSEIDGYRYWKYAQNFTWKITVLSSDINGVGRSSSDLTESEAWHAVTSGMTGGSGVDGTGM